LCKSHQDLLPHFSTKHPGKRPTLVCTRHISCRSEVFANVEETAIKSREVVGRNNSKARRLSNKLVEIAQRPPASIFRSWIQLLHCVLKGLKIVCCLIFCKVFPSVRGVDINISHSVELLDRIICNARVT